MFNNDEIKQTNDREIFIGKHSLYLEDKTIYITPVGAVDENEGIEIKTAVLKLLDTAANTVTIIGDLNNAGKPAARVRRLGVEMFSDSRIKKIALFGLHPVARIIALFVIELSKRNNIKFFNTKEEALAWLKV